MEERILKKTAIFVAVLSVTACISVFYLPRLGTVSEEILEAYKIYQTKTKEESLNMTGLELLEYNNEQAQKEQNEDAEFVSQLRLELPLGVSGDDLEITQNYVTQTINIVIPYANSEYFYEYPMLGRSDNIDSLTYESRNGYGIVEFVTDQVFELDTSFDKDYFYIDFLTPQEVYDKVVVIDAGHGGNAPGATKQGIYEKDIDLSIVLKLKEIIDASGNTSIGVYYTRLTDENPSFEHRVGLANKSNADLLISVHNNSTPSGRMSSINGTEVLYDESKESLEFSSMGFAQICLEEVIAMTGSANKGLVTGSEMYIIRNSEAPVALIEVGFMTNQVELTNLCSEEYQMKVAQGIYNAILRAFAEGY